MNADRFDAVIRTLTAAPSRRTLLIGSLGGLFAAGGLDGAAAKKKKKRKKCPKSRRCGGKCRATCGRNQQRDPNTCQCICALGFADCDDDGQCENLLTDPNNCLSCGFACLPGTTCEDGVCTCPDGRPVCFFGGGVGECCAADETCQINSAGEGFCRT